MAITAIVVPGKEIGDISRDNARFLELAQKYRAEYVLIDDKYEVDVDL